MKIGLRTTILGLFASLLIAVCSLILYVHHRTSINSLMDAAKSLLRAESNTIEQEIENFASTPKLRLSFVANLLKDKVIIPSQSLNFAYLLTQMFQNLPGASGMGFADLKGNMYMVEREENAPNNFFTYISKARYATTTTLNSDGKAISKPTTALTTFDPRTRPWYQKALPNKGQTTSGIYLFYSLHKTQPRFGISIVQPVYTNTNKLNGMLFIDVRLDTLSTFITNLQITPHSTIFIFDNEDKLFAAKLLQNYSGNKIPTTNDLTIPWAKASLEEYRTQNKPMFFYKFQGKNYLAIYDYSHQYKTTIAIVVPVSDIIAPLIRQLLISILFTTLALLIGLLLVLLIANALSKPMVRLAHEAFSIKNLELSPDTTSQPFRKNYISELADMQEAFTSMKQSLRSFVRYVPATLVRNLMANGDIAHVGGESKTVTFLFSDITGFTSLSEKLAPKRLMIYLSEYLENMTGIVLTHQGTVDKYIGDAIMAFWNAPIEDKEHATHACQTAILMCECLEKLNKHWSKTGYPTIAMRIGISTGAAVIGNVGSEDRLSYTAIGDSVNLTNRLEELNKLYNTKIIVSEFTYQLVKDKFLFRFVDYVTVRGKHNAVHVYELLYKNEFGDGLADYNRAFTNAFDLYSKGNWQAALDEFQKLLVLYPNDQLLAIYLERCNNFKRKPPTNWAGIWRA